MVSAPQSTPSSGGAVRSVSNVANSLMAMNIKSDSSAAAASASNPNSMSDVATGSGSGSGSGSAASSKPKRDANSMDDHPPPRRQLTANRMQK